MNITFIVCLFALTIGTGSFSWAGSAIDLNHLVPAELGSPFNVPLATLREQNRALEERVRNAMAEITVDEQHLFESKKFLEHQGYNAEEFMAEFHRRVEQLPAAEQALLDSGDDVSFEMAKTRSAAFRNLYNLVNVGVHLGSEFIEEFETYDQKSQDLEIAVSLKLLRQEIEYLRLTPVEGRGLEILKGSYQEILKYKDDYLANKFQYGKGKDIDRVAPFNKFISKVRSTIANIHRYDQLGADKKQNALVKALVEQGQWIGKKVLPPAARWAQKYILSRQPNEKRVPITTLVNRGVRVLGALKGERVAVIGRENLPPMNDPDTVNIIFPNHGDASIDMLGIAKLGIDNAILFVAAGNFLPDEIAPGIIEALNNNKGVVVVGDRNNPNKIDPIDKLMAIESERARPVILFPQGMRPARDNAASPVREGPFLPSGPIRRLLKFKKVNIVTVTMDYFTPYGLNGGNSDPTIVVRVHPTIPDKVLRRFMAIGGSKAMPILLQYGLLENLRSSKLPNGQLDPNGNVFWGKVRASQLDTVLANYLRTKTNAQNGLSCLGYYAH